MTWQVLKYRHQPELLSALESSCPPILGMPGQRFPTAGWGSRPPGGQKGEGERTRGGETQGAELRNMSVHPWTQVAALRVPSLTSALRVVV